MTVPIRVGIMGFGRIGRNIFRQVHECDDIEVVAISDLSEPEALAYALEYDTIYGGFPGKVELDGKYLLASRQRSRLLKGTRPDEMPWDAFEVDVVIEATSVFRHRADLQGHLDSGARRVILSTPALDSIDRTVLHGINHDRLVPEDRIISCSSATTVALGLILKILDDAVGVQRAAMTTVHAYSSDQKLADTVAENPRRSRSAAENLIPNWTWAPSVIEQVLPQLAGKIGGMAVNVPVPNGSNLDLVTQMSTPVSPADVNEAVREAARDSYSPWVEFTDEPLVSRDVIGNPHSAVFDSLATVVVHGNLVKTITWYDNGWGYAARIVDTIRALAALDNGGPA